MSAAGGGVANCCYSWQCHTTATAATITGRKKCTKDKRGRQRKGRLGALLWNVSLVWPSCVQHLSLPILHLNLCEGVLHVECKRCLLLLHLLGKLSMLHAQIHGPLQSLVSSVDHFLRQPLQRGLHVQIVFRVDTNLLPGGHTFSILFQLQPDNEALPLQ